MKLDIDKIKKFLLQNKNYVGVAVAFVVLVVILVLASSGSEDKSATLANSDVSEEETEEVISVNEETPEEEVATNELTTDEHPKVNELINNYFKAMAESDIDSLLQIVDNLSEEEQNQIAQKKEYIEDYSNIVSYTKIGPIENSYIVFAYYEMKLVNIDTLVPGLVSLYVCQNDDGSLYIYNGELDPEVDSYIKNVAGEQDVIDLLDTVEKKYIEAQNSDEALDSFIAKLTGQDQEEEAETSEETASAEEETEAPEEPTEEETTESSEEGTEETVYAKETVNIRAKADQDSEKLGQIILGESMTRTEVFDNGWSKIIYEGQEAYVMSQYLTYDEVERETLYLTSTVNIRAEASESADRIGTGYLGGKVVRLWKLDTGWSQIVSDGVTGYVKSEFLSTTNTN